MKTIELSQGLTAVMDDDDFELYGHLKWYAAKGYAVRSNGTRLIYLHRLITKAKLGEIVDHKNLNKRDNRKSNLHIVSAAVNAHNRPMLKNNTTGYKGVNFYSGWWVARLMRNNKRVFLGCFDTPEQASVAYQNAVGGVS